MRGMRTGAGFTLVELMITVGIIGILATIAIPAFNAYIKRSKMSEISTVHDAMFKGALSYWNREFVADETVSSSVVSHCTLPVLLGTIPDLGTMEPGKKYFADFESNVTTRELGLKSGMYYNAYGFQQNNALGGLCFGDNLAAVDGKTVNIFYGGTVVQPGATLDVTVMTAGVIGDQLVRAPGSRVFKDLSFAQLGALDTSLLAGN